MILENCNEEVRVGRQYGEIRESVILFLVFCKYPSIPGVSSSEERTPEDEVGELPGVTATGLPPFATSSL